MVVRALPHNGIYCAFWALILPAQPWWSARCHGGPHPLGSGITVRDLLGAAKEPDAKTRGIARRLISPQVEPNTPKVPDVNARGNAQRLISPQAWSNVPKGHNVIAWGNAPGIRRHKNPSPERARCPTTCACCGSGSIPHIPFIDDDTILSAELAVLIRKGDGAVVFFLTVDVALKGGAVPRTDGEHAVTGLPLKSGVA